MRALLDASWLEDQYAHGGIARVTRTLYEYIARLQPSIQLIYVHRRPLAHRIPNTARVLFWKRIKWKRPWRALILPAAERYIRPDFVHFPANGHVPRLWPSAKVVTTLHDVLPLEIPNFASTEKKLQRYFVQVQSDIRRTHLLITDSQYSKKQIMARFDVRHEPVVIYPACELSSSEVVHNAGNRTPRPYFIYVGGYSKRKGLEQLITVFLELHKQTRLTSGLLLTGEIEPVSSYFRAAVDAGKAQGIIEELGFVPDAELATLIAGAKALLYPSKYEGFGLPVLEGMTLGCPVLTTPFTSIPEVGGDAVLYADPDSPREFAATLIEMEANEDLRHSLIQRGYAQAARFSWERTAEKYLAEFYGLCRK